MPRKTNVPKATVAGATAGAIGAPAIAWGSSVIEAKYGVPAPVAASILGGTFAFIARWAAKLNPHD